MFLKLGVKILFIVVEVFLGFYSIAMSDSLLVKFLFFAVTAAIIAFLMVKFINKILPVEKDSMSLYSEEEN
ncbi:hypothetical protein [Christiangramia salexigens]|uniref:Uncharacterized protein n=1 Tax=Christiangramia salexigens TaxID=1913577 RepID=A0A1L3J8H3_9FLAO|nr:hypothetical protein [Christiangramia salexigens]APG61429.1 hypothetical protein LPB144_08350 [Christiangramia salexigens]